MENLKHLPSYSDLNCNINNLLHNLSSDQLNQPLIITSHLQDYFSTDAFLSHPNNVQIPQECLYSTFAMENAGEFVTPASEYGEISSSNGLGSASVGNTDKKNSSSGRKRKRKNEAGGENPKEVVHVRAKRGQATDSHSLAERVRRERINDKLKVLQDLVPGCYKTMGMAVMLEVIINYVRSLQNQIEFLSMKLSAASMYYDFNSPEAEAIETLQRTATPYEAQETAEILGLHSTWPF